MTLASRFELARKRKGLSQEELGDLVGMSQGGIGAIEEGRSKIPRKLVELASVLDVDPNWLLFGDSSQELIKLVYSPDQGFRPKSGVIPVLSSIQILKYFRDKETELAYEEVIAISGDFEADCIAMRVETEAMESSIPQKDTFENNCIIVIKPSLEPKNGDYVVATLDEYDEDIVFRKLVIEGGKKYLKPLNTSYESFVLTEKGAILGVEIRKVVIHKSAG